MPSSDSLPRQVLLFSGHRVDAPGRAAPRFPPALVPSVAAAIGAALDAMGAGPDDLALTQAAAGGDLLFSEACLARDVRLHWMLPLPEAEFIARSVCGSAGPEDWPARYRALKARLVHAPVVMAAAPGDAFERANRWLVERALSYGLDRLRFICVWDGAAAGDGAGGTAQMVDEVRRHTPRMTWIDTRSLGAPAGSAP